MTQATRCFTDYTPADHARVAWAARSSVLANQSHDALLPSEQVRVDWPLPEIRLAEDMRHSADRLAGLAVIIAYEDGASWADIGRALGVSRQAAHDRYAKAVQTFREELAAALNRVRHGKPAIADPGEGPARTYIVDTPGWAALADELAASEMPGAINPPKPAGSFQATLSHPNSLANNFTTDVRSSDAPRPMPLSCQFRGATDDHDTVVVCTLPNGHTGNHQLAVHELE